MFINVYPFQNSRWDLRAPAVFPGATAERRIFGHLTWVSDVWRTALGRTVFQVTSRQWEPMLESLVAQENHLANADAAARSTCYKCLSRFPESKNLSLTIFKLRL